MDTIGGNAYGVLQRHLLHADNWVLNVSLVQYYRTTSYYSYLDGATQQKGYNVASRHFFECMGHELLLSSCNYDETYGCQRPAEVVCKHGTFTHKSFSSCIRVS